MITKQVDKEHYEFSKYMTKPRWSSIWHQINELSAVGAKTVLEIGPGLGFFKSISGLLDVNVETLDLDPALSPDHVGSAMALPFKDEAFDLVCAFQMLEHLPYEDSIGAFKEMVRVAERAVIISLPDARVLWSARFYIPRFGYRNILIPKPALRAKKHQFDGEHYWEVNKSGYSVAKVLSDFSKHAFCEKTYRVPDNPYHRFFIFSKKSDETS